MQDYDIPHSANFIAAMHDALTRSRHLIVLLTKDYAASRFTMMELTNFLAAAGRSADERRLVVLRVDDCDPEGILAGAVFGDLVGIADAAECKRRILAAAEGRSTAQPRRHKLFENVPPRDARFTGRDDHLAAIHDLFAGVITRMPAGMWLCTVSAVPGSPHSQRNTRTALPMTLPGSGGRPPSNERFWLRVWQRSAAASIRGSLTSRTRRLSGAKAEVKAEETQARDARADGLHDLRQRAANTRKPREDYHRRRSRAAAQTVRHGLDRVEFCRNLEFQTWASALR